MLEDRTYQATKKERAAVDKLLAEESVTSVSVTRTEPDERGPLRVDIAGRSWLVHPDGRTEQETP